MSNAPAEDSKNKFPKFIRDEAAAADAFEGPHERVAKAVAEVIDADPTLKVVGLLGAWGSGKSTVLRLVQNHTKKRDDERKNKTYFFVYDAWLHQNDPPRRSFLEMLVTFLTKSGLTTKAEWAGELDRLNRQIEDTETTVTPTFTPAGRALLASALLLPLGFVFIGHDWLNEHVLIRGVGWETTVFELGLWMLFLPVIVSVFIYLYWRTTLNPLNGKFWHCVNWTKHRRPYEGDSILSIFMKKEVERSRHRVVRSPDPTTIEFQAIFRKIMQSVTDPARRFVFVVDNLDRLPEKEAVALWTTMRSFFLGVGDDTVSSGLGLPTVILPIDPGTVERMFADTHKADARMLARSFMDKTFDLTFRVSPPVSSDWVTYLEKQMKFVFGDDCSPEWIYSIRRLYDRYITDAHKGVVTPREINTLLNSVALLRVQWSNEIPFQTLAYFSIYRDAIDDDVLQYLRQADKAPVPVDPQWRRNVAAVHFGVPVNRALQVLLRQPLQTAIQEAKQSDFDSYCDLPGAYAVLEQVVENGASPEAPEPEFIANAAYLIQRHTTFPQGPWLTSLWDNLRQRFALAQPWQHFDKTTADGLAALIEGTTGEKLVSISDTLATKLASVDAKLKSNDELPREWYLSAAAIVDAADSCGYQISNIQVPGNAKTYLGVVLTATDKPSLLTRLVPAVSDVDVMHDLLGRLSIAELAPRLPDLFNVLIRVRHQWPWNELTTAARVYIETNGATAPGIGPALTLLGLLRASDPTARDLLNQLSTNEILLERLQQAHGARLFSIEALVITLLLVANPTPQGQSRGQGGFQIFSTLESSLGDRPQVLTEIEGMLDTYSPENQLDTLVSAAKKNPSLIPLARALLHSKIDSNKLGMLSAENVTSKLQDYFACLDNAHQAAFLRVLAQQDAFWQYLESVALDAFGYNSFRLLIADQDQAGKRVREVFERRLRALKKEEWEGLLESGAEPYPLIASLPTHEPRGFDLGGNLSAALQSKQADIPSLAKKTVFVDRWFSLAGLLSDASRRTLFRNVRDQVLSATVVPSRIAQIFNLGGERLISEGGFADEADKCARHLLLQMLASEEGQSWLNAHTAIAKGWLDSSLVETRSSVTERLMTMASQESDANKGAASKLAAALGLELHNTPAKEEGSSFERTEGKSG